ncbi:hypothetical protein [Streptomyces sp. NPDC059009]|uniref:hypothetical protein n=1 Tax=Streptomyces sp. NPDC059009 TaxID=3346694 RepID=UPI0036A7B078
MARGHGRILTSIWEDADFLTLEQEEQRLYLFLISQPNLNHAGLLPLTLRRWARKAAGLTVGELERLLAELEQRRFVVVDRDTEELLIRTFVRNDGVWKQPKVMAAMVSGAEEISSAKLRRTLLVEMDRLPLEQLVDDPGARGPSVRQQVCAHVDRLRQELQGPDQTLARAAPSPGLPDTPEHVSATGTDALPDSPGVSMTRARASASHVHPPAPASNISFPEPPLPALSSAPEEPIQGQRGVRAPDRTAERFTAAWWDRFGRRTAQSRRSIHQAVGQALANGLDVDELWVALSRLGDLSKPVTGTTLQFALSEIRRGGPVAQVVDLCGRRQQATTDLFDRAMSRASARMKQASS